MSALLITRPEGQQHSLMAALTALATELKVTLELNHQPLIAIEPVADDSSQHQLRSRMMNIDGYDSVIAISKNAAEIGLDWLDRYWPQLPEGIDWYAVGPTTAEALRQEVLRVRMPPERFDSEGVLALPSLAPERVREQKVLIWRGVGGRETLANVLRQRGAEVDYAELYQRNEVAYSAAQWQQALAAKPLLILSSGQALDIVEAQVADLATQISAIVVPSERVAERARAQGYQVLVAASARDEDVVQCVREYLLSQG